MKRILVLSIVYLLLCTSWSWSQNVGIGTTEPGNKLHVTGNFLVNQPYAATNTAPTMGQTKTMINNSTITYMQNDSTGRFYDPGGPGADYSNNLIAYADIPSTYCIGIEVTIESIGLGTGDSLIFSVSSGGAVLLALGNGYTISGKRLFQGSSLYARFISNSDTNNGIGFSIFFRRLYDLSTSPDLKDFAGNTFFYDTKNAALRAGFTGNDPRGFCSSVLGYESKAPGYISFATGTNNIASGDYSTAMGHSTIANGDNSMAINYQCTASGNSSVAMGYLSVASGISSVAMGYGANASGYNSIAMGSSTTASGDVSTAMGAGTFASGYGATAMGSSTTASGDISTAMGGLTTASGLYSTSTGWNTYAAGDYSTAMGTRMNIFVSSPGSFSVGDYEPSSDPIQTTGGAGPNSFTARFRGGYYFLTSQNAPNGDFNQRTGVICAAGQNSWSAWSDVHRKENFLPVDGEYFLRQISSMPQYSWNYKGQSPETFRHYGPMAQDIFSAFGHDAFGVIGNDTMINQQDLLGIQFNAIQALEKRTTDLQNELNEYKTVLEACLEKIKMLENEKNEGKERQFANERK